MKKMQQEKMYSLKDGEEFTVTLQLNDLFISFHRPSGECCAFYYPKSHLSRAGFAKIYGELRSTFGEDLSSVEVKTIGTSRSIVDAHAFFSSYKFEQIKKVQKEGVAEVLFLPKLNKVRVSIETVPHVQVNAPEKIVKRSLEKIKVLIVDDSKTIRMILSKIFSKDERFQVVAMAEKPSEVEGLIVKFRPDVITLDIHMPEMDGVELLKIISPKYNIPTVMISSISMAEGPLVLEALENGAIDYIQKPEMSEIDNVTPLILEKVKVAAMANLNKGLKTRSTKTGQTKEVCNLDSLILLGSSTGGTEAIRDILTSLPNQIPPILIVQHIPAVFSAAFAKRMNELCPFEVKEAENGDEVCMNKVLIAPGGKQMKMVQKNKKTFVEINDDEPVNRFKPSVDYLFLNAAKIINTQTVAVILTGMGKDGAKGMLELKNKGVRTIAQNEETSVVFGMPKEAIALGGAEYVEPLSEIAERMTLLTHQQKVPLKKLGA